MSFPAPDEHGNVTPLPPGGDPTLDPREDLVKVAPPPSCPINALVSQVPKLTLTESELAMKEVRHHRDTLMRKEAFDLGAKTANPGPDLSDLGIQLLEASQAAVEWCAKTGVDFPWLKALRHAVGEVELLDAKSELAVPQGQALLDKEDVTAEEIDALQEVEPYE